MSPTATEDAEALQVDLNGISSSYNGHKQERQSFKNHLRTDLTTSYPSQSLRFLRTIRRPNVGTADAHGPRTRARRSLNIIIVGAGLGGLAAAIALAERGHSVRVLEQAPQLGEVGAGIQIPPNSGRLLQRWGVFEYLQKWTVKPEGINFRRWENGNIIGYTALGAAFQDDFEVPYYVVHRAHLHEALYQRGLDLGVKVELGRRVIAYQDRDAAVIAEGGAIFQGDLVIAADGIKSKARELIHPYRDHEPRYTGFAAYRATVDVTKMRDDPDIAWILQKPSLNIWIGEDRHVMTYTIAAGESFNMVLSHVDHSDPSTWTQKFAKEDIQHEFVGWDPKLTKIISHIDECMKWPLKVGSRLNTWTSPSSKLVIMGDAAHAMLPYMSQGAAMAVEDGAALAIALNHITSLQELPFALSAFEKERIRRSGDMLDASTVNGLIWHFSDGVEQRARDASMAAEVAGLHFTSSANQWSDPITQRWAYGYDAEEMMEESWTKAVSELILRAT